MHEPKDPSHHDGTTKPLLATSQVNKTAPSNSKPPQTSKAKKNYNSKKSLGIKSIRTRRGEHENANNRESSGKGFRSEQSQKANLRVCLKDGKDNLKGGSTEDGRETPDEIKHNKQCNFTPPWTNSPEALNKTGTCMLCVIFMCDYFLYLSNSLKTCTEKRQLLGFMNGCL